MHVCNTFLCVAGATAAVVLVGWLIGRWRGRKYRPGHAGLDPRLAQARRRHDAGEMSESELRRVEEHLRER